MSTYVHDRPVKKEWQDELDSVAGGEGLLKIVWHPGVPWEPMGRYCIYELFPMDKMGVDWHDEFQLGPPRVRGRWVLDPEAMGRRRWVSTALISQMQYEIWKETGKFPAMLWVVQGDSGGHLARLTLWQEQLFKVRNPDAEWPAPGELPFAEPSQKTWALIAQHNRLKTWDFRIDDMENEYAASTLIDLSGSREQRIAAQREKRNEAVAAWLEEQMYAVKQLAPRGVFAEAREGAVDGPVIDSDQIKEEFIKDE